MFLLIPGIIIFLCFSYIKFNPDISIFTQSLLYSFMVLVLFTTYKIYKNIQNNIVVQEKNKIQNEINQIFKKLSKEQDEKKINILKHKIEKLQQEIKNLDLKQQ